MILVWRGQGWVVLLIEAAALAAMVLVADFWIPDAAQPAFFSAHGWPFALVLGIAGAIILAWGAATNHQPAVAMIDPETGLSVVRRTRHSLYFIPVEYWGAASLAGAAAFLLF